MARRAVVVCGPGHVAQTHKADEYLGLDQVQACLDILAAPDRKLAADG
jgi:acetylornithine deacetylase